MLPESIEAADKFMNICEWVVDSQRPFRGFWMRGASTLKAIDVDGGDGCITPSHATIADGSYPLARALYIYVNTDKAASNPALSDFIDYYLSDEGLAAVSAAGYVDLPADEVQATRDAWSASK